MTHQNFTPLAKRVAIIGGGPSGAISLNTLRQEGIFEQIVLFERKTDFGGSWRADPSNEGRLVRPGLTDKQTDPTTEVPVDVLKNISMGKTVKVKKYEDRNRWSGSPALYPSLRTNVPERIMAFSDDKKFPFLDKPDQDELTKRESIEEYIVRYVNNNVGPNVDLRTKTSVEKITKEGTKFNVYWKKDLDNEELWGVDKFDSLIIATGHYNVPRIPYVRGIEKVDPKKLLHTKGLVPDETWKDKSVIVIGSRSSAVDTVRELKQFTNKIIWSVRLTNTQFNADGELNLEKRTPRKPTIKEFKVDKNDLIVVFEDNTEILNPDYIVYATGYHFSFPFLNTQYPDLTVDGKIINNLYQHTFLIDDPLVTFIGTPIDGMSFRVFEIQSILVARYFAGKVVLPSVEEQKKWHKERLEKYGATRHFHSTVNDPALSYIESLVQLGGGYEKVGSFGKTFPRFSDYDIEVYQTNKERLTARWSIL